MEPHRCGAGVALVRLRARLRATEEAGEVRGEDCTDHIHRNRDAELRPRCRPRELFGGEGGGDTGGYIRDCSQLSGECTGGVVES